MRFKPKQRRVNGGRALLVIGKLRAKNVPNFRRLMMESVLRRSTMLTGGREGAGIEDRGPGDRAEGVANGQTRYDLLVSPG